MSQSHFCCWFSMKLKIQRVNGVPLFDRFISFFITCMWHNDKYISATLKLNDDEVTDLCLWLNTFILITLTPFACDHSRENVKIHTIFIRYQCKQGILYDINNNKKSAAITTKMTWYLQEYVISCWLLRFYCIVKRKNFIISHSKNVQLTGDFPGINGCVYVYYANEMKIPVCGAIAISQVVCKWNGNETIDAHWHSHAIQVFMLNKRIKLLL